MGMYDNIRGKVKCPKCNKKFIVDEQVKWTNDCFLHTYEVGDDIDASDGIYSYATYVRPELYAICEHCKRDVMLEAVVEKGKLKEINVTGYRDTEYSKTHNEI